MSNHSLTASFDIKGAFVNASQKVAKMILGDEFESMKSGLARLKYQDEKHYQRELLYLMIDADSLKKSDIKKSLEKWDYNNSEKKKILKMLDSLTDDQKDIYQRAFKEFGQTKNIEEVASEFSREMYYHSEMYQRDRKEDIEGLIWHSNTSDTPLSTLTEAERLEEFQERLDRGWLSRNGEKFGFTITAEDVEQHYKKMAGVPLNNNLTFEA